MILWLRAGAAPVDFGFFGFNVDDAGRVAAFAVCQNVDPPSAGVRIAIRIAIGAAFDRALAGVEDALGGVEIH